MGNLKLTKKIKAEVKFYQLEPDRRLNAQEIRNSISDAVHDLPDASFQFVVQFVAGRHVMSAEELLKHYLGLAEKAFDKAHLELKRYKENKRKFEALMNKSSTKEAFNY